LAQGASIQTATSADVAEQLEFHLLSDLRQSSDQGENTQIILELRDNEQTLIGGLVGSTSYGWLLIKILWIARPFRKQGHGRALVASACSQAKRVECHSVWLETSDKRALEFYYRLGFVQFGVLSNAKYQAPEQHCRVFLKKDL
jgi:GNAT superfamily N-acetyltransferase